MLTVFHCLLAVLLCSHVAAFISNPSSWTLQGRLGCANRAATALHVAKKKKEMGSTGPSKSELRELEQECNAAAGALLEKCTGADRDLAAIQEEITALGKQSAPTKPAKNIKRMGDWRLVFVSTDKAIDSVGTGLHRLALTRMEDLYIRFTGNSNIETIEVLRVLGPFPNVRNSLTGDITAVSATAWSIRYALLVDGTGKEVRSGTAATDRKSTVDVAHVGKNVMVLVDPKSRGQLVFKREPDIARELDKLRVALDDD